MSENDDEIQNNGKSDGNETNSEAEVTTLNHELVRSLTKMHSASISQQLSGSTKVIQSVTQKLCKRIKLNWVFRVLSRVHPELCLTFILVLFSFFFEKPRTFTMDPGC